MLRLKADERNLTNRLDRGGSFPGHRPYELKQGADRAYIECKGAGGAALILAPAGVCEARSPDA